MRYLITSPLRVPHSLRLLDVAAKAARPRPGTSGRRRSMMLASTPASTWATVWRSRGRRRAAPPASAALCAGLHLPRQDERRAPALSSGGPAPSRWCPPRRAPGASRRTPRVTSTGRPARRNTQAIGKLGAGALAQLHLVGLQADEAGHRQDRRLCGACAGPCGLQGRRAGAAQQPGRAGLPRCASHAGARRGRAQAAFRIHGARSCPAQSTICRHARSSPFVARAQRDARRLPAHTTAELVNLRFVIAMAIC